eukprot:1593203-Pyramimonas_sp.AAC.1
MQMVLLPKPEGGVRAVGLAPGAPRPFTRWARNTTGSSWASLHRRDYIYGAAGLSCETCAWIQAATAE